MNLIFPENINPFLTNRVLDVRNTTNHPISLLYSEIFDSVIVNGIINDGRLQPGYSLAGYTPFTLAAKMAVKKGLTNKKSSIVLISEVLRKYYSLIQRKSASDWFDLKKTKHNLNNEPPWAAVYPWRARNINSYRICYEKAAIRENATISESSCGIEAGWLYNGPLTEMKIKIEAERLALVLYNIDKNGYKRTNDDDGDARATALISEQGAWKWLLTSGIHRACAASALGFDSIPVRINLVVKRSEYVYWPHVIEGTFSEKEALDIFDRLYCASTPSYAKQWIDFVNRLEA